MAREFADRIQFAHLRNVTCDEDGSFVESQRLDGRTDMVDIVTALLQEEHCRRRAGRQDSEFAMRPGHGHILLDDISKIENPGDSCFGRLKGLPELRDVIAAVNRLVLSGECDPIAVRTVRLSLLPDQN